MTSTANFQIGLNYAVLIELLKYSPRKFYANFNLYRKWIFQAEEISLTPDIKAHFQISQEVFDAVSSKVIEAFKKVHFDYDVIHLNDDRYPQVLKSSRMPPPVLYVRGDKSLFKTNSISVVGSRTPSEKGLVLAPKLSFLLVEKGFTVVSGLAKGIDAAAHNAAIKAGGKTIGVIGTPLDKSYPPENKLLQDKIADSYLLVSQFPFSQHVSPYNFPTRNYTMQGLSLATIIVEASDRSGALIQARQCLQEDKPLFFLSNLLERTDITWPETYRKRGAKVLGKVEDVTSYLEEIKNRKIEPKEITSEQLDLFESEETGD